VRWSGTPLPDWLADPEPSSRGRTVIKNVLSSEEERAVTVTELEAAIRRGLAATPVVAGYLFGSRARGTERFDSDTDLACLLPSAHPGRWASSRRSPSASRRRACLRRMSTS